MKKPQIIDITNKSISEYPVKCFLKPDNEGYLTKLEWIKNRFSDGLKIKQLYQNDKLIGFIEYIPGEYAWRSVDAKEYLFIHCIWIYPNANKKKGYGSLLVNECIKDAEKKGKLGVAVVTSEGAFMASKDLFLKNGFRIVASAKPSFNLMVKTFKKGSLPKFRDWEKQLSRYEGLNIIFSNQCPWVVRSIDELCKLAKEKGLDLKVTELKSSEEAQNAPSVYASFNLVYNRKLLSDHYISSKRFQNILNKEI